MARTGLGRGLDVLLGQPAGPSRRTGEGLPTNEIPLELVRPNRHQPRTAFDPEGLSELAASIVSALLGLAALAGGWRLAQQLGFDPRVRAAVAFLTLAGSLEAFAGYAESAGLFVAGLVWWLALLVDQRPGWGHRVRVLAGWVVLAR